MVFGKKLSASMLLVLFFFIGYPQKKEFPSFGKPDRQELLMKECMFEKDAGALKLLDFQVTEIIPGYDLKIQVERRVRIKIFNQKGFEAANISIPYIRRNKKSKITDISAYIYNVDSTGNISIQKIDRKQIFHDKSEDGYSNVAFTFPNVKPGCVVEYRYTHTEKNSLHLEPWFFQDKIPTAVSFCKFIYPSTVKIDFRFITSDSVVQKKINNLGSLSHTFTLSNISAFRPEPLMSSIKDNLQRIEFAFVPRLGFFDFIVNETDRWKIFNLSLLLSPFFGMQIHAPIAGTETLLDSVKKISTPGEKVHYIFQQVKRNLKWDYNQSFYSDDLEEVWKNKSGNSAEINLTILNLLRKSGISCYPILISTRDNGKTDPDFLSMGQFNGVDVLILDSTNYYILDGTQRHLSYKATPFNILNRDVFIVDTLNSKWINIADTRPLIKSSINVKAELANTGELKGEAFISYYDHSKAIKLSEKEEKDKEEDDDEKEFIEKESADLTIDTLIEENTDDELLPLNHRFGFTYKLSKTSDFYFIDPFFLSNFRKNPFTDSLRRTDIDLGSNQFYNLTLHLTIPEEFIIEDLPKNLLLRMDDSSMLFKRVIIYQKNVLVFRHTFEIQRAIYIKEEHAGLRDFFRKVYGLVSEQIVLKKKS